MIIKKIMNYHSTVQRMFLVHVFRGVFFLCFRYADRGNCGDHLGCASSFCSDLVWDRLLHQVGELFIIGGQLSRDESFLFPQNNLSGMI